MQFGKRPRVFSGTAAPNGGSTDPYGKKRQPGAALFDPGPSAGGHRQYPLTDEFGKEFALFAAEQTSASVVMLVKSELADEISHQVEEEGILIVEKPMSKALFLQAVKLSMAAQRRMRGLQHENDRLQQKIQEIRLVDRAKCLLIEHENMAEGQAHRYIEKQAMDQRKTRGEVARDVLRRYDLET